MPKLGKFSLKNLETCDERLQRLVYNVAEIINITVTEGYRGPIEQNLAYERGYSKLKYPESKHNSKPSEAVHLVPYIPGIGALIGSQQQITTLVLQMGRQRNIINSWIREQYTMIAGIVWNEAHHLDLKIRWGGDWDRDLNLLDNRFDDLAHYEIYER